MAPQKKSVQVAVGVVLVGALAWSGTRTIAANRAGRLEELRVAARQGPSYPLDGCLVTGARLDAGALDLVHDGRLVRVASADAAEIFLENPRPYLARLDAAVVEAQRPGYPLRTCLVAREPLGSMGEIVEHVHGTRLVRMCCDGCIKPFELKAETYLAQLDAAWIESQREVYPLDTCLVTGIPLGEDAVEHLYGTTLVRVMDAAALEAFLAAPEGYLQVLAAARE